MNPKLHNLDAWADAHVFYDFYEHDISNGGGKIAAEECRWRQEVLNNSPHGELLIHNSFFDQLKRSNKVYLAHVTPNIHNIQKDGILYSSSGCLVGSIYCVPAIKENGKLRLHNLGDFIFRKEMPYFSKYMDTKPNRPTSILLIEVDLPKGIKSSLIGTDYLQLGNIHYRTFKELEYLLSSGEDLAIKNACIDRVRKAFNYLCTCNRVYYSKEKYDLSGFLELFRNSIEHIPMLGYFYFEVLSEYIMLYQNNETASFYHDLGEFYSESYKDLIFYLCPKLTKHFSLTQFRPSFEQIVRYIKTKNIFSSFDPDHLLSYLTKRLIFLTNARFYNGNGAQVLDWKKIKWDFDDLSAYLSPLFGHLIHRELRTFGRYPHFYFYFDQTKALQIWNYWNHMNVIVPFNGIIPKGEIGINPAYPDLKYKIYSAKSHSESGKTYLEPTREESIKIVPKLIDPKFTTMGENKKEKKRW